MVKKKKTTNRNTQERAATCTHYEKRSVSKSMKWYRAGRIKEFSEEHVTFRQNDRHYWSLLVKKTRHLE